MPSMVIRRRLAAKRVAAGHMTEMQMFNVQCGDGRPRLSVERSSTSHVKWKSGPSESPAKLLSQRNPAPEKLLRAFLMRELREQIHAGCRWLQAYDCVPHDDCNDDDQRRLALFGFNQGFSQGPEAEKDVDFRRRSFPTASCHALFRRILLDTVLYSRTCRSGCGLKRLIMARF